MEGWGRERAVAGKERDRGAKGRGPTTDARPRAHLATREVEEGVHEDGERKAQQARAVDVEGARDKVEELVQVRDELLDGPAHPPPLQRHRRRVVLLAHHEPIRRLRFRLGLLKGSGDEGRSGRGVEKGKGVGERREGEGGEEERRRRTHIFLVEGGEGLGEVAGRQEVPHGRDRQAPAGRRGRRHRERAGRKWEGTFRGGGREGRMLEGKRAEESETEMRAKR